MMQLRPTKGPDGKRRQWGADSHQNPMPVVPRIAGEWSMVFGRTAVVFTVAAWVALVITVLGRAFSRRRAARRRSSRPPASCSPSRCSPSSAIAYLVGPPGLLLPRQPPSPRAAGDDRRVLRGRAADAHRAGALLPGGAGRDPDDAPVDRAAGVPGHAAWCCSSTIRPSRATRSPAACSSARTRAAGGDRAAAVRASRALRSGARALSARRATGTRRRCEHEVLRRSRPTTSTPRPGSRSLSERYQPADHNDSSSRRHVIGQLASDLALTARRSARRRRR